MKIKTNDTVLVITGKDKGKIGKVIKALPAENKVIVEGVNIQTRHMKARQEVPASIMKIEGPIDVSNVMLLDKNKIPVRVGYKIEGGKKVRVAKKTGTVID
jgi:large subunit ribosomal protein L24